MKTVRILPVFVAIDMLAVSLVVPLLQTYYKTAGVSSAMQREFLSSAYSTSQIVGGLAIGLASDSGMMTHRSILMLSFLGSSFAYGMIGFLGHSIYAIIASRIIVGSVKQTMTVTTAMLAKHTSSEDRTGYMGLLTASSTFAWIVGPSLGALLYKYFSPSSPPIVACWLFIINFVLAVVLLPKETETHATRKKEGDSNSRPLLKKNFKLKSFTENLHSCFTSPELGASVICLLLFSWVDRATSYASLGSFYEDKYGIETYQRGYISSYQSILLFMVQSRLVRPLLQYSGGECRSAFWGAVGLTLATVIESWATLPVFVVVVAPMVALSVPLIGLSLKSLLTKVAPKDAVGSALAATDVLQNAAAVTVPFYRTTLFTVLDWVTQCLPEGKLFSLQECSNLMSGDPEPFIW
eukprot:CAMPEP_0204829302 /NCGR_PEP_ID=MMETSP1346-20131115/7404_1 /ASSEMBLY_ACC=CAM_ASM_000771 /TAXON_ID=215587 /ORGANISM="Aplanochytrium stocchinoi, Strain GSBS06" /LENGTH=408 /DNA_ID=CAMNT_0051958983 /DNA_START=229 /DNA_END=1452 /DNA_ORIENTATION=+